MVFYHRMILGKHIVVLHRYTSILCFHILFLGFETDCGIPVSTASRTLPISLRSNCGTGRGLLPVAPSCPGPFHCSIMTCALVPPSAKQLTPAVRFSPSHA